MLVRFDCPACHQSHSFDMPETIVFMRCPRSHKTIRCRLTAGGDVRTAIVDDEGKIIEGQE